MRDLTHLTERVACFRPPSRVFSSENLTHLTQQTHFPKSPNRKVLKKSSVKVGLFGQFGQVDGLPTFIPGTTAPIRRQVLRELVRLSEMARSIENPRAQGCDHSQLRAENERKLLEARSARSLRLAGNGRDFMSIRSPNVKRPSAY